MVPSGSQNWGFIYGWKWPGLHSWKYDETWVLVGCDFAGQENYKEESRNQAQRHLFTSRNRTHPVWWIAWKKNRWCWVPVDVYIKKMDLLEIQVDCLEAADVCRGRKMSWVLPVEELWLERSFGSSKRTKLELTNLLWSQGSNVSGGVYWYLQLGSLDGVHGNRTMEKMSIKQRRWWIL